MLLPSKQQMLSRFDGIILLFLFCIFIAYLITLVRRRKEESIEKPKYGMISAIILLVISIALIAISSDVLVNSAVLIAKQWNVSEKVITMVLIVIGTSLPELIMTVRASQKQEYEMAIGNIVETNIFNICVVLGLPIVLFGPIRIVNFHVIDIIVVLLSTIILYIFSKSDKKLTKIEGFLMLIIFILYYGYLLFMN